MRLEIQLRGKEHEPLFQRTQAPFTAPVCWLTPTSGWIPYPLLFSVGTRHTSSTHVGK